MYAITKNKHNIMYLYVFQEHAKKELLSKNNNFNDLFKQNVNNIHT